MIEGRNCRGIHEYECRADVWPASYEINSENTIYIYVNLIHSLELCRRLSDSGPGNSDDLLRSRRFSPQILHIKFSNVLHKIKTIQLHLEIQILVSERPAPVVNSRQSGLLLTRSSPCP